MSRVIEAATLFAVGALAGGVIVYGARRTAPPPPTPPPAVQQDVVSGEIVMDGLSPHVWGVLMRGRFSEIASVWSSGTGF
jgi:hypothetical protein